METQRWRYFVEYRYDIYKISYELARPCFCDIQSVVKSWISQISIAYGSGNFDIQNIACAKSELDKSIVMA